jgi:hypothetical protein
MTTIFITRDGQQDFHVKLQSGDSYVFKSLIDALKNFVSPVYRKYEPNARKWVVGEPATESFRSWLSYARATFGAQVQWIGGEAYAEYETECPPPLNTPPPPPPRPKPVDPYTALHLLPSAPAELVKAAYRTLAQIHHPDHGGSEETMKRLNEAFGKLLAA